MSDVPLLPKVPANYFQEQQGLVAISALALQLRCIWRPTPNADLRIDGQLELVNEDGVSSGKLLAMQIKSGESYINKGDELSIHYYPEDKHRHYWSEFPIPVILAIHDPATGQVHWQDARRYLRSNSGTQAICNPRNHILDIHSKDELFETCGAFGQPLLPVPDVVKVLASTRTRNPLFDISFLDLYVLGLLDIGRKLFFSMTLCSEIAEARSQEGIALGNEDHLFLDQYVRFLVSQGLIYYDFYDYLINFEERRVVPIFVCPFTARGQAVFPIVRDKVQTKHLIVEHFLYVEYGSFGLHRILDELSQAAPLLTA